MTTHRIAGLLLATALAVTACGAGAKEAGPDAPTVAARQAPSPGSDGQGTPSAGSDAAAPSASADGTSCSVFPADSPWNTPVTDLAVHERSGDWVSSIGDDGLHPDFGTTWEGEPNGIPYNAVDDPTEWVDVTFDYDDESDPGPYPISEDAAVEADSDGHLLVVDQSTCTLYELFDLREGDSGWEAGSGAIWDLSSNDLRPETWTSADAAGLPILPGLVRYDEVASGHIDHALRFTAEETQDAYIHPATHAASDSTDPRLPPMGARFRLSADFDCSSFSHDPQVICEAMKQFGMFLADNGGNWFVSGAPDSRWDDDALHELDEIPGSAFEVVDTGEPIVTP